MTGRAAEHGPESRSEDELEQLRGRVSELEATIAAISRGDVDALVVNDESGKEQLYTLRSADTPYQMLVEQMQEGALSVDRDGIILYANRRFAEMLGVPLERVIGSRLGSFVAATQGAVLRDLLGAKCQPGESARREVRFVHASGGRFPAYVSISALTEENHVCAVVTDLTEQKRAEQIAVSERKHPHDERGARRGALHERR
jgi:PAS domain S-box-containing protein